MCHAAGYCNQVKVEYMRRALAPGLAAAVTASVVLLFGPTAAYADDTQTAIGDATIVLNDGTVVDANDVVQFTFVNEAERPAPAVRGQARPVSCSEVNDPPTYTVKGVPYFMADEDHPQSTWLLPRQDVTWTVTGSHTFTWDIGAGVETEAGAIIAKAKVKIDSKISNSWTWTGTQTVRDTNTTSKGYRAVLGQVGWNLQGTKTWFVPPCTAKTKTVPVKTPRQGDMSIGRQNS